MPLAHFTNIRWGNGFEGRPEPKPDPFPLYATLKNDVKQVMEVANTRLMYNTSENRLLIKDELSRVLENYMDQRAIHEYKVVCDETNNSPESIDNNCLFADIYVERLRGQGIAVFNMSILHSGVIDNDSFQYELKKQPSEGQIFSELDPYGEENWEV
jgi:hypothetical protein